MNELVGHFDGAYIWEGGHAAYGCVVKKNGAIVFTDHAYLGASRVTLSVNCAEYAGLISILKYLISIDADEATIYGDSKLVIEQMNRRWRAKNGPYLKYYVEAALLRNKLPKVTFRWIPRLQNDEADCLSKLPLKPYYRDYENEIDQAFEYAIEKD